MSQYPIITVPSKAPFTYVSEWTTRAHFSFLRNLNSQSWVQKMVHVALFLPVGPSSYMFIHKTPCDDVVAAFGGIWSADSATGFGFSDNPLFREDILDDLACRRFRVSDYFACNFRAM